MDRKNNAGQNHAFIKGLGVDKFVKDADVHVNVAQELIVVTVDKAHLCLSSYLKRLEGRKEWITPGSILLSIILTFVSSEFKQFGFITADTWRAIFLIMGTIVFVWFLISLWGLRNSATVEEVIRELKNESDRGGQKGNVYVIENSDMKGRANTKSSGFIEIKRTGFK